MQKYLVLDYETFSECDLKKSGAYEYAFHPSTEILCAAYRIGTEETLKNEKTKVWRAFNGEPCPLKLGEALCDPTIKIIAHNAFFEQAITRSQIGEIDISKWACTASMAAAMALPRNLDGVCQALKLKHQKDKEGHRLMLKLSKPRRPTKHNPSTRHTKPEELERLALYCERDIDAEVELFLKLNELSEIEREIWLLDQKINFRGFNTDTRLVEKVLQLIDEEVLSLKQETKSLTYGRINSTSQRDEMLNFLKDTAGIYLPDLRANTVKDYLNSKQGSHQGRRLLEIRQSISKSSTAKYKAFLHQTLTDGRVRDFLMYHGASTGRWAGKGVQIQNLTRGSIKDASQACEIIKTSDLETVRLLYGNPMEVFSSCLRGVIVPSEGHELFCGDYAAVESRVLFWVAGEESALEAYRQNRPMYEEMAAFIYKISQVHDVTSSQRQLGKAAILGAGYGMGPVKFLATCLAQGQVLNEILAKKAIYSFRERYPRVPELWHGLERAAIYAVQNPGKKVLKNKTQWVKRGDFLVCVLPSGRCIYYPYPEVRMEPHFFYPETKTPKLYHWGVNPLSKKWEISSTYGGKLTENIVQAISRDLMAAAMRRVDAAGYQILLSVHDELLAEKEAGKGSVAKFQNLMVENPPWAVGLPTKVEAWTGKRYRK